MTDENQQPLPGVSVTIEGTKLGTVTNASGVYSIAAVKGQVLTFKFIGYTPQSVTVGDNAIYNISFKADSRILNEVVVTALGIRKETKRLGYSVQEIKGAELTKAREANAINGLTGKIAGLNEVSTRRSWLRRPCCYVVRPLTFMWSMVSLSTPIRKTSHLMISIRTRC